MGLATQTRRCLVAALLAVGISGAALFADLTPAGAAAPRGTWVVDATSASWLDTGLLLKAGETIDLTASGDGTCHTPAGGGCPAGDASGSGHGTCAAAGYNPGPAPDQPWGAVVGRLGMNGNPFLVGSAATVTGPGTLQLAYNDCQPSNSGAGPGYSDNAGSYTVTATAANALLAGTVTKKSGGALAGATLQIVGPDTKAVKTGPTGAYSARLRVGQYTVTPSFNGQAKGFTPPNRSVDLQGDRSGINFAYENPLKLSVDDQRIQAPKQGTKPMKFHVALSGKSTKAVTAQYTTRDGTGPEGAKHGVDYVAAKGTVRLAPGQTKREVPVQIKANPAFKGKVKRFQIVLSKPTEAELQKAIGVGTITKPAFDVKLSATPTKIEVQQTKNGAKFVKVNLKVKVTNPGSAPIDNVTLPSKLQIGWHTSPAPHPSVPLKLKTPPKNRQLGTLGPGKSKEATYALEAQGDGDFDVEALVLAADAKTKQTLRALGSTRVKASSQFLVVTSGIGREPQLSTGKLIKGGTHFTIEVALENRSYQKRLAVMPPTPALDGNAADGQLVEGGKSTPPAPDVGSLKAMQPTPLIALEPRETRYFYSVIRTLASPYKIAVPGAAAPSLSAARVGGTRGFATFVAPAFALTDPNKPRQQLTRKDMDVQQVDDKTTFVALGDAKGAEVALDKHKRAFNYTFHIDDSAPGRAPSSLYNVPRGGLAIAKGLLLTCWDVVSGVVGGIPDFVKGAYWTITHLPTVAMKIVDYESELWASIQDDPVLKAEYGTTLGFFTAHFYHEWPRLQGAFGAGNAAAYNALAKIQNEWMYGDWEQAVTDWTHIGTASVAIPASFLIDPAAVSKKLAGGVLLRFPKAAIALELARTKTFNAIEDVLASRAIVTAREAASALKQVVKPGYLFKNAEVRKLFGLSAEQYLFLKRFALENKIVITLRSRAVQSIEWLNKGALLKPGWIKRKNVNWLDIKFFGYRPSEMGLVVIRELPAKSLSEFEHLLQSKHGLSPNSLEFKEAVLRYQTREKELEEVAKMHQWAEEGRAHGEWNWEDNGIPHTNEVTNPRFRLARTKDGALVPQVKFDNRPWPEPPKGAITGDVDLLDIRYANGEPLSPEDTIRILNELRHSPVGAEHPFTANWKKKNGDVDFNTKHEQLGEVNDVSELQGPNELGKCCALQIGADGLGRAVQYSRKKSRFLSTADHFVWWEGGYNFERPPGELNSAFLP